MYNHNINLEDSAIHRYLDQWLSKWGQKNLKYKLLSLLDTRVSDGTRSCEDLMVCACYQAAVLIKLACI